jgi:hypothetical protein
MASDERALRTTPKITFERLLKVTVIWERSVIADEV